MPSFSEDAEHHTREAVRELALQSAKQDSQKNRASNRTAQARRHWVQYWGTASFFPPDITFLAIRLQQRTRSLTNQHNINCLTSRKHCAQLSGAATKIEVIATLSAWLKDCKAFAMMHSSLLSLLKTTGLEQMKR
ncbi:hypothetical protein IHE31_00965 (plasmid) [Mycetohabitans rhizoxinica]|uniref:hypothetical protein n=1 Tax=Mycetohabitans rhizoxinica TaxID=412963 RepID=UPI0030D4FA8D